MTIRERALTLINALADEPQLVREIATWCIIANAYDTISNHEEADDPIALEVIRAEWPEAGEKAITLGHNLALAVVEVVKAQPIGES
jgi:hypothetical protein